MKLALPAPGFLPTAWALMLLCATVAAMLFIAAGRKKLRSLLATEGTLGWSGGTMILMSGFFVFSVRALGRRDQSVRIPFQSAS